MCEIFCFNSNTPKQVNECLQCFYNHSEEHPHGWGLANMHSNEFVIDKEPVKESCCWKKCIRSYQISHCG